MGWKTVISLTLIFFLGVSLTLFVLKIGQLSSTFPQSSSTEFLTQSHLLDKSSEENRNAPTSAITTQLKTVRITRVIDGDTIETADGKRIRYIGIDTPETSDPRKPVECFGREATARNKELVLGKEVALEKDVSETDQYGRLLRYVWIMLPDSREVMINEVLVEEGYAFAATFPPDVKYQQRFLQAQRQAREEGSGLWSGCPVTRQPRETPDVDKETSGVELEEDVEYMLEANTNCIIKGNISSKGEKIYHLPGCASYNKTVIDESKGEQWFCMEEEAVKAGWRKAKNC